MMKTCIRSSVLLLSVLTALPALADRGTVHFEGQVVESGCTVNAVSSSAAAANVPTIAPGISLRVSSKNDACAQGSTAFTAQYTALDATQTGVEGKVITLSYN